PKFKWRSPANLQRRADEVADAALAWLNKAAASRFFAWLHFYDPHAPYDPPEPYRSMHADQPYDGEIGFVDDQIGRVLGLLAERHLLDRTIVVAVMTTSAGAYEIYGVSGTLMVQAAKDGYISDTKSISVAENRKLDFELRPTVAPLPIVGNYRL